MKIVFFSILIFTSNLFSQNYSIIHSLDEASKELEKADENSLVIFDVDNVLIASMSRIYHPQNDHLRQKLSERYFQFLSQEEKNELQSIVWQQSKFRLMEAKTSFFIDALQQRKIPTIALTSLGTGRFGLIKDMVEYRADQLKLFCIDFSQTSPNLDFTFYELNKVYGNYPIYRDGILFTNWYQNKKGDVLVSFLEKSELKPKKIIFFDDSLSNLDSVKEKLPLDIEFIGFHYQNKSLIHDDLDHALFEKQFEYLRKYKCWLDDKEMLDILVLK